MSAAIKPEIYISWIPNGKIIFTPQIYATVTFTPHVEKATADTSRNIKKLESFSADLNRKIGTTENPRADLRRTVKASENISAVLNRRVANSEKFQARTFRKLTATEKARGKLLRQVKKFETVKSDTARKIGITTVATDLFRVVKRTENISADLLRRTGNDEKATSDTFRKINRSEKIFAETLRRVVETSKVAADTFRRVATFEKVSSDTFRKVAVFEKISADTFLKITATEKVLADTCRRMLERASAETLRKVIRPEKFSADTVIKVPHVLNLSEFVNSFKDYNCTNFEITLNERTLSDSFKLETANDFNINDAVQGIFLDYPYSFLVEETSRRDLIQSVSGMYDIDKLLYTFIEMDLREEKAGDGYYKATSYIRRIANYLGLTPNVRIADFIPYNLIGDTNITYTDLISSLFSWTSRLPQRQINVFIRGKTLHCIQRGLEDSVFDISDIPHSRPTINKKLIRSMYNNPFPDKNISDETYDDPFSGTIQYGDSYGGYNRITYANGLLIEEYTHTSNNKVEATNKSTYSYVSYHINGETQYYLEKKVVESTTIETEGEVPLGQYGSFAYYDNDRTKIYTKATSEYIYSWTTERAIESGDDDTLHYTYNTEIYLRKEYETNLKVEYFKRKKSTAWQETDRETNDRQTLHTPAGNGWYATTVFENGEYKGSSISQGSASNQVSQYTIQEIRRTFGKLSDDPEERYEELRSRLAPIADISFPVRELDLVQELTQDLLWLNRKIQVTVSVDLISRIEKGVPELKHVVDFTERILFEGKEYFLVSNNISFTPRQLIQKLQLVRWEE